LANTSRVVQLLITVHIVKYHMPHVIWNVNEKVCLQLSQRVNISVRQRSSPKHKP